MIGGCYIPVERNVLRILLRGIAPAIIVLARGAQGWRAPKPLGPAIKAAVAAGSAQIVSSFLAYQTRNTVSAAKACNRHVLTLAPTVQSAHVSPGGKTEILARELLTGGLSLQTISSPRNANLKEIGAQVLNYGIGQSASASFEGHL